jgi:hypothetical protein
MPASPIDRPAERIGGSWADQSAMRLSIVRLLAYPSIDGHSGPLYLEHDPEDIPRNYLLTKLLIHR